MRGTALKHQIKYQFKFGYLAKICCYLSVILLFNSTLVISKERLSLNEFTNYKTNIELFINNLHGVVNNPCFFSDTQHLQYNWNETIPNDHSPACCYAQYDNFKDIHQVDKKQHFVNHDSLKRSALNLLDSIQLFFAQKEYKQINALTFRLLNNPDYERFDSINYEAFVKLGLLEYRLKNYKSAITNYENALRLLDKDVFVSHNFHSLIHRNLALCYRKLREPANAIGNLKTAIDKVIIRGITDKKTIASYAYLLGIIYQEQGFINSALLYFSMAENNYLEAKDTRRLLNVYSKKSHIYRDLGDHIKGIDYSEKILFILNKQKVRDLPRIAETIYDIGIVYFMMNDYEAAIQYFNKSLAITSKPVDKVSLLCFEFLSLAYLEINDLEKAYFYFDKVTSLIESKTEVDPSNISSYMNFGVALIETGESDKGLEYFQYALALAEQHLRADDPVLSKINRNIGEYYFVHARDELALDYFYKSIIVYSEDSMSNDMYKVPNFPAKNLGLDLVSGLKKIGLAFYRKYYHGNGDVADLKATLDYYEKSLEVVDAVRYNISDEESKLILSSNEKDTYTKSIEVANSMYDLTGDAIYRNKSFGFAERSKAVNLLAAIRNVGATKVAGISDSLLEIDNQIQSEVIALKKELFEARKAGANGTEVKDRLFDKTNEYEAFVKKLERENESYEKQKNDLKVLNSTEIQKQINPGELFVEYVITNNKLVTYAISNSSFRAYSNPIDSVFLNDIDLIVNATTKINFATHKKSDFINYVNAAYRLYKLLIAPLELEFKFTKLIITPDEMLSYVPFEILVTEDPDQLRLDYRLLPYLIKKYTTSYAFSGTLLFENETTPIDGVPEIMAFAANYEHFDDLNDDKYKNVAPYAKMLIPLDKVAYEVDEISKLTGAKVYRAENATEDNFTKHHQEFDILHLAMHTIIENTDPMFSKLAFTPTNESLGDGFLNTYEIYSLPMTAQLAVLSACNTGDGKLRKGEGVMSFARSFFYSGCPSVIMTLWPVEDKAGSGLMIDFYASMVEGASISNALRNSKLKYLEQADPLRSHPFFWAGFVSIGQDQQLYKNETSKLYYLFGLLLILPILWYLFRKGK